MSTAIAQSMFDGPEEFKGLFSELSQALNDIDFTEPMTDAIPLLEAGEKAAFDSRSAPGGEPWAPNAPSTIRRKGHGKQLFETGRLGSSLFGRTSDSIRDVYQHGLTFGTSVPYSVFNQEGTPKIPARVHVGMSEKTLDAICDGVADFVVEQMKG